MVTGRAQIAGVIGWPVSHSLSPVLHGFWLDEHDVDGTYIPLAVEPENLKSALRALPALGFRGVNITVPHKQEALHLCDEVDPLANRIGAVNTIVIDGERLIGSNTDGFGFIENLKSAGNLEDYLHQPVMIIGAGGAARGVIVSLLDAGASSIRITNRTRERAVAIATDLGPGVEVIDWDHRAEALDNIGLLVNTTALGMTGQPLLELSLKSLPTKALVTDIVYAPLITPLLQAAETRGNAIVDGLGMLLHQARPGFQSWFGCEVKVTRALRAHVLSHLAHQG